MPRVRHGGVLLILLGATGLATQAAGPANHSVVIENMQYSPATLAVRRGERIEWVNKDLFPHTVTATGKAFDSGSIPAGGSWTYVTKEAGELTYGCTFHPTMKGALKIQ